MQAWPVVARVAAGAAVGAVVLQVAAGAAAEALAARALAHAALAALPRAAGRSAGAAVAHVGGHAHAALVAHELTRRTGALALAHYAPLPVAAGHPAGAAVGVVGGGVDAAARAAALTFRAGVFAAPGLAHLAREAAGVAGAAVASVILQVGAVALVFGDAALAHHRARGLAGEHAAARAAHLPRGARHATAAAVGRVAVGAYAPPAAPNLPRQTPRPARPRDAHPFARTRVAAAAAVGGVFGDVHAHARAVGLGGRTARRQHVHRGVHRGVAGARVGLGVEPRARIPRPRVVGLSRVDRARVR